VVPTGPEPTARPSPSGTPSPPARVVVGVDGSPGSRAALDWAMVAAARKGAGLEVGPAFPGDLYWVDPYLIDADQLDAVRADTEARARALVHQSRRRPAVAAVPGTSSLAVEVIVG